MKWKKLGQIFTVAGDDAVMHTHATNPVAESLGNNCFRVYFSPRDNLNRGQIFSLVIELTNGNAVVQDNSIRHVLSHGQIGRFDDSGITVTGLLNIDDVRYLYYLGWNLGVTIPFRNSIGVAISESGNEVFKRISEAPIVDRNRVDPISLSYPFLLKEGDVIKIWYGSCIEWDGHQVKDYRFSLKYAESQDGINWLREGRVVLECKYPEEDAIARPHVVKEGGVYKMWYSRKKGLNYRMGYAESGDGIKWERKDHEAGIDVSDSGWDSEMIEYPHVFDHDGQRYMLYNGNGYGRTGFGLAVLEA